MKKIKKDKNHTFCLNSNNINENVQKKINKKRNNDIKEFNKDRKIKKIINESNEQINQYKLELLKKFKQIQTSRKILKKIFLLLIYNIQDN